VRLSRPRLLLRAALLLVAAGFMAWRATETSATAGQPGLDPAGAVTLARIALVEWLLAGLALLTAGAALLTLRQKPRRHSLHLSEGTGPDDGPGAGSPEGGPASER